MSGIFLGNRTKIFYNPDAGNTTVNSVGYVEIDNLAEFPTVTISSDNTSIETYQDEYTQIISDSLNINSVSIVVHYVPDNLSHQYLLDRFSDGEKFQIKISLYENEESLDQHYIILGGYCTAYSDSSDQNAVFDRTYTFTAEDVVSRGTAQDQPNLSWGDFGVGADGLTVPHYESSTPSGNSLIKVPALQEQNPLGVDMYGTAWVDGTDTLKLAGNAQGTPHLYVQNSDTAWTKLPEQSEIDATFTPMTRKLNGYDLSTDIVLSSTDTGSLAIANNLSDVDSTEGRTNLNVYSKEEIDSSYVPKTLTVNGHYLSTDIVLSSTDTGSLAIANNLSDIDATEARTNLDVYSKSEAVPSTLTINGYDLSTDIVLSSTDTGSLAIENNLSDVDATEARTNLNVYSKNESDAKYAQLGINSDITDLTALSGSLELGADAQSDYDAVTLRQLQSAISAGGSGGPSLNGVMNNQIGAVSWFAGTRASMWSGYLPADGQLLNRADYPDIWSAISNGLLSSTTDTTWTGSATERAKYSTGDGSTTFRMPDLNGAYSGSYLAPVLRGDGSGTYTVGQMQQNAAPNITGTWANYSYTGADVGTVATNGSVQYTVSNKSATPTGTGNMAYLSLNFDASRSSTVYGRNSTTEIRMNSAVGIWVIRVKGSFSAVGTNFNVINADTTAPSTGTVVYGGDLISKYQVGGADYAAVKLRARTTVDGAIVPEITVTDSRGSSTSTTSFDITTSNKRTIYGLDILVSATSITVHAGEAYIPGLGRSLEVTSDITLEISSTTASTWYHIYLYDNDGSPAIEYSSTVPVDYAKPAKIKTGDSTRRYLGSFRSTSANAVIPQFCSSGNCNYEDNWGSSCRILAAGTASTSTSVVANTLNPSTAIRTRVCVTNTTSYSGYVIWVVSRSGNIMVHTAQYGKGIFEVPLLAYPYIYYYWNNTPPDGGAYIDIGGYTYER